MMQGMSQRERDVLSAPLATDDNRFRRQWSLNHENSIGEQKEKVIHNRVHAVCHATDPKAKQPPNPRWLLVI
jgi:hypothetical protein